MRAAFIGFIVILCLASFSFQQVVGEQLSGETEALGGIKQLSMTEDGSYVAVCGFGFVSLYHGKSLGLEWTYRLDDARFIGNSIAISSDASTLLDGFEDSRILLFKTGSNRSVQVDTTGPVLTVSSSADGTTMAAGTFDGKLYKIDGVKQTTVWEYQNPGTILSVMVSRNGQWIVAGTSDNKVLFFSSQSQEPRWVYHAEDSIRTVAISDDGLRVVAGSNDSRVYLWENTSEKPKWIFKSGGLIRSVSVSGDGTTMAAGGADGTVYAFKASESEPIWRYPSGGIILTTTLTYDGSRVAAGGGDGKIYVFSTSQGQPLIAYQTSKFVTSMVLAEDGSSLAAASDNKIYYLATQPASAVTPTVSASSIIGFNPILLVLVPASFFVIAILLTLFRKKR